MEKMDDRDTENQNNKSTGVIQNLKSRMAFTAARLKLNPLSAVAILLAAFVVLTGMAIALVVKGIQTNPPVSYTPIPENINIRETEFPTTDRKVSYDELMKQLKLILFEYNVNKEAVQETSAVMPDTFLADHQIQITVPAEVQEPLINSVTEMYRLNKLSRLYSSSPNEVVTETDSFRLAILIKSATAVTPPAPPVRVNNTPPVQTPSQTAQTANPADVHLYPFGVTPPPPGNGQIALLIDDAGNNLQLAERLLKVKAPMAFAILPYQSASRETADLVRRSGQVVFLHFPMEPLSYPATDPGPGAVLLTMPEVMITEITKQNVENLGGIQGANNHTGSAFTEDAAKMKQVLESLRPYTTSFVDSNTSPRTVAYEICRQTPGFTCGINRKFLDNENAHDYIASKMYEAVELANKQGPIIIIGHLRPDTITVLEQTVPLLQNLGYKFIPIKSVMD